MSCPSCNIYLAFFTGIILGIVFLIFVVGFAQVILDEIDKRKRMEAHLNNQFLTTKKR